MIHIIFVSAVLAIAGSLQETPAASPPDGAPVNGIDVSRFQGDIDWAKVAGDGISFAFIRATQGITFTDPKFAANWKGANDAGVICGAYHFLQPGDAGVAQAKHFLLVVTLEPGHLPPVVDVETMGRQDNAEMVNELMDFLAEIKRQTGLDAIVYASPNFFKRHIAPKLSKPLTNPFWIAQYDVSKPTAVEKISPWSILQHSDTGNVAGIEGHVDLDKTLDLQKLLIPMPPAKSKSAKPPA